MSPAMREWRKRNFPIGIRYVANAMPATSLPAPQHGFDVGPSPRAQRTTDWDRVIAPAAFVARLLIEWMFAPHLRSRMPRNPRALGYINLSRCTWIDVGLSPARQAWVRTYSDVRLGPLQVSLSSAKDIGMSSIDLRRRVLPCCMLCAPDGAPGTCSSQPHRVASHGGRLDCGWHSFCGSTGMVRTPCRMTFTVVQVYSTRPFCPPTCQMTYSSCCAA